MQTVTILEPDLRCILADNPSPMTGAGTNTYILGNEELCIIDPGPQCDRHLAQLMAAIGNDEAKLRFILVTHSHLDHPPLARALSQKTGAAILAFGATDAGRSALMRKLNDAGVTGGGEGVDQAFVPDQTLVDGTEIRLGDEVIRAIWTPGHYGNHMCYQWRGAVFSGDHVMGWASSLVSPPDGDLNAYMASLEKLLCLNPRVLYPGHGAPVCDPASRISDLRNHRLSREASVLAGLSNGPKTISQLVHEIYADTPKHLHPAAARNIFAHLIDLWDKGKVDAAPKLAFKAVFTLK